MKVKWARNSPETFSLLTPFGWSITLYKHHPEDKSYWLYCPVIFTDKQLIRAPGSDAEAKKQALMLCKERLEFLSQNIDKLEPV